MMFSRTDEQQKLGFRARLPLAAKIVAGRVRLLARYPVLVAPMVPVFVLVLLKLDSTTRIDRKWRLGWEISQDGLPGADLAGAELAGLHLPASKLEGANLSGADLSNAELDRASLSDTNLSKCNLQRTVLWGALLVNADLSGADLSNAVLGEVDLTGAKLTGADLTDAWYSEGTVWPAGFVPPPSARKTDGPCYVNEQGQRHCWYIEAKTK